MLLIINWSTQKKYYELVHNQSVRKNIGEEKVPCWGLSK